MTNKPESLEEAAKLDAQLMEQYKDIDEPVGFASGDESKIFNHDDEIQEYENEKAQQSKKSVKRTRKTDNST